MAGKTLKELLFGTQTMIPYQPEENQELNNYLNTLGQQPYMQGLLNQPQETGLTLDQYKQGFKQGLNFGVPELAEKQKEFNINIPKTPEELELAQSGEFNKEGSGLQGGLMAGPVEGGFFNDLASGYKENYNNGFSFDNLKPQNKGFATRLGEGLGTVGRFIDSPFGRGLIAAGLDSALGYDNALQEGLTAMVGRQNNMTQDKLYRQSLIDDYGFDPEEIGNIRGNISRDLYNTIAANRYKQASLKVRQDIAGASDNTKRANMIMTALNNGMITPGEAQMQMAKYGVTLNDIEQSNNTKLLPYKQYAMQVAPQVALGNLGVAQGNLGLNAARLNYQMQKDEFERNNPQIDPKTRLFLRDKTDALQQIQNLRKLVNENPNATGLIVGSLAKGKEVSQKIANSNSTKGQIQTRAGIAKLRGTTMHDLAGTAQTLQEQRNLAPFLPDATDDARTINAKLDQLEAELQREYSGVINSYGGNIPQMQPTGGAQTIGKYKVRVK